MSWRKIARFFATSCSTVNGRRNMRMSSRAISGLAIPARRRRSAAVSAPARPSNAMSQARTCTPSVSASTPSMSMMSAPGRPGMAALDQKPRRGASATRRGLDHAQSVPYRGWALAMTERTPTGSLDNIPAPRGQDLPLIVQGDRTILAEVASPRYAEARDALARFAELVKSPEHVHTYRLTALSIWNACAAGERAERIVEQLRSLS